MIEIRWSKKYRPAKADNGHSVRQAWAGPYRNGFMSRSYVRCECGTRLSGQGESGGLDSHRKHVKREAVKRATPVRGLTPASVRKAAMSFMNQRLIGTVEEE